jgi:hypothetical protein
METLAVCETLGAGMGAKQKEVAGKGEDKVSTDGKYEPVGNAPLRLWVGERFLGKCFPEFFCHLMLMGRHLQKYSSVQINLTGWRSRMHII